MSKIACYDSDGNLLKTLYQWDTNQVMTVKGLDTPPIPAFHFCNRLSNIALVVAPEVSGSDLSVKIPNVLLQQAEPIIAYVYQETEDEGYRTMHAIHIPVIPRPKPDDYEYEDNIDYISVAVLNSRLNTLSKSMSSLATVVYVDEKFGSIPAWAKTSEKPTYTAEEVGAISTADLQTATNAALAQAKASGMFDGAPGDPGAKGDPGKNGITPVRGTDYWTASDKQEMVNAVLAALPNGNEVSY